MATALVAVLRTQPETVIADYGRLMRLAKYDQVLGRETHLLLKLNLSWTKYFPACSTQPWQLEGVVRTLRMCHERGLGIADPRQIEVVGDDVAGINFGCRVSRSLANWGDQPTVRALLRPGVRGHGERRWLERLRPVSWQGSSGWLGPLSAQAQ